MNKEPVGNENKWCSRWRFAEEHLELWWAGFSDELAFVHPNDFPEISDVTHHPFKTSHTNHHH